MLCSLRPLPLLLLALSAFGQSLTLENARVSNGEAEAVRRFDKVMAGTHHLYSGPAYLPYAPIGQEHPFFGENRQYAGKIKSDGIWYTDVPMKYDLQKAVLVVPYFFGGTPIELVSPFIDEFEIDGHRFIHIKARADPFGPAPGFYESLSSGRVSLFAEWKKSFSQSVVDLDVKREFALVTRHFIIRDHKQYAVPNRRALLKLLADQRVALRAYLRRYPDATLAQLVDHYNALKP